MYDIGIIGGGTAGLTAAIYGQRAGKRTLVIEGLNFGGQIVNSPKVENYPGLESISGSQYSMNLLNQAMKLGAADYIAKPLNPDELLGKIKELVYVEEKAPARVPVSSDPGSLYRGAEPSGPPAL